MNRLCTLTFVVLIFLKTTATAQKVDSLLQSSTIDSATLFLDVRKNIHAIAFDTNDRMFVAGSRSIYYITPDKQIEPFATLADTSAKTRIWSMCFNRQGDLYIAAYDRIIRVTSGGKAETVIKENFPEPGASDVKFDKAGNLYVVYPNEIARYDSDMKKTIVVDGKKFGIPVKWSVGLAFDNNEETIYLGDCLGHKLYIIPYRPDYPEKTKYIRAIFGQYFASDNHGNVFLTINGTEKHPEFIKINQTEARYIYCKARPYQDRKIYKKTIAYRHSDDKLYCIIGNKIYVYDVRN